MFLFVSKLGNIKTFLQFYSSWLTAVTGEPLSVVTLSVPNNIQL